MGSLVQEVEFSFHINRNYFLKGIFHSKLMLIYLEYMIIILKNKIIKIPFLIIKIHFLKLCLNDQPNIRGIYQQSSLNYCLFYQIFKNMGMNNFLYNYLIPQ